MCTGAGDKQVPVVCSNSCVSNMGCCSTSGYVQMQIGDRKKGWGSLFQSLSMSQSRITTLQAGTSSTVGISGTTTTESGTSGGKVVVGDDGGLKSFAWPDGKVRSKELSTTFHLDWKVVGDLQCNFKPLAVERFNLGVSMPQKHVFQLHSSI